MVLPELQQDAAFPSRTTLLEAVPVPAYACDARGYITVYNERAAALWGRRPRLDDPDERFCGPSALLTAEGEVIARGDSPMALTLRDGVAREGETALLLRPDGERRTVLVYTSPVRDRDGRLVGATAVLVDISERVAKEQTMRRELAALEASFHAFFDSSVVGTAQADASGRFVRVNDCYCSITGYSREELLTMRPLDLDHPDDLAQDLERVRRAIADPRGVYHAEKRYLRKDGTVVWVDVAVMFIRDASGATLTSAAIVTDISERKRAEQALQQADRAKDEFLATLAHELRNPLAPLSSAVELLRFAGVRESGWCRDVIERQVQHLARLIDDLLDVSRITRDKLELRRERLDFATVLSGAIEASRPALDRCEQELVVGLPAGSMHVDGDLVRLTQVFTNLLTNAAKFTTGPSAVQLKVTREDETIVVRIKDDGVGIAPEELERIFDKFYQSSQNAGRFAGGGLGIGLSLVRRIVELHGGSVSACSGGLGMGSEFTVRLPMAGAATPAGTASPAPSLPKASGRRVVIIDDNADSADSLAQLLELLGYETAVAYDGAEALERVCAFIPDIVLLDLGMPGMDGFEVCRQMRAMRLERRPTIVAMTGWGRDEDRTRTTEAGFDHHLVKPVDRAALERVLASAG